MEKTRVKFDLNCQDWHGSSTETLWTERYDKYKRKVINIPFLAFGISFNDIINIEKSSDEIENYHSVFKKGGHSTYRLMIDGKENPTGILEELSKLDCLYEIGRFGKLSLVAVSIPREVDIIEVYSKFEKGCEEGIWDFEESNFEHF